MKIHKNIKLMGLVSFFTDVSSEMILPILPLFLTITLGANMAVVGLVFGLSEATASLMKTFSGYWSDKTKKRKPFILAGYTLSSLTKPLLALSTIWPHVLLLKFLDRAGKGIRDSPRDALIAASSKKRGTAFGFHRMLDNLGAVVGTLIASYLLYVLADGFRLIFWLAFIPAIISVLLIPHIKEIKPKRITHKIRFSLRRLSKKYKRFVIIATLFNLFTKLYQKIHLISWLST